MQAMSSSKMIQLQPERQTLSFDGHFSLGLFANYVVTLLWASHGQSLRSCKVQSLLARILGIVGDFPFQPRTSQAAELRPMEQTWRFPCVVTVRVTVCYCA